MVTRLIGGVPYTIQDFENYLGLQFVSVAVIPPPNMASLGAPENATTYALCAGVPYRYVGGNWIPFYPPGNPGPIGESGPPNTIALGPVEALSQFSQPTARFEGDSPNQTLYLGIPKGANGSAGPANTLSIGAVTTLAAGANATASISGVAPNQTLSIGVPVGAQGLQGTPGSAGSNGTNGASGPPNTISIGTVSSLAAGATPTATITGAAPSQTLNLGIPAGASGSPGSNGSNGPVNTLSIGTVSTLSAGAAATASVSGAAPNQTLNIGIPQGAAGAAGSNGANGAAGVGVSPAAPAAMTVAFATAYQVADPLKAAHINIMIESAYTTTIAGTSADEVEIRIGSTNAVATGGGSQVATWKTSLTGIALTVGLGLIQRNPVSFMLPPGWFFAVRRLSGTTATIISTAAQPLS